MGLFPKIEYYYTSRKNIYEFGTSGIYKKIENFFKFFKISYVRNYILINSLAYDILKCQQNEITEEYIVLIDTNHNHKEAKMFRGYDLTDEEVRVSYSYVAKFLKALSKTFNKKMTQIAITKSYSFKLISLAFKNCLFRL